MHILFTVGSTGGHLMPAMALAQEFRDRGHEVFFLTRSSVRSQSILESWDFPYAGLPAVSGSLAARYLQYGISSPVLFSIVSKLLAQKRFGAVVAAGSLDTLIPAWLARRHKIFLFLLEQNILPGRANRLLKWISQRIYYAWPHPWARGIFGRKGHLLGNPLRSTLKKHELAFARLFFGLDPGKKTILVVGGSQGSHFLNHRVVAAFRSWNRESLSFKIQVLHVSGDRDRSRVESIYRDIGLPAKVVSFIEPMDYAYSASDVVIARAGGLTLSEILYFQKPALLIPYPYALDDHQRWNAYFLSCQKAAFLLEEKRFSESIFKVLLERLLFDDVTIRRMKDRMGPVFIQHSREQIVEDILRQVKGLKLYGKSL